MLTQPILRRLITRCIGLIPSVAVAASLGRAGVSTLLVVSQVVLSIVLPFIVYPLVYITSSARFMGVRKPRGPTEQEAAGADVEAEREDARERLRGWRPESVDCAYGPPTPRTLDSARRRLVLLAPMPPPASLTVFFFLLFFRSRLSSPSFTTDALLSFPVTPAFLSLRLRAGW